MLDELEKLAKAATPGPWRWGSTWETMDEDQDELVNGNRRAVLSAAPCGYENSRVLRSDEDGAYIAACSPETVLALVKIAKLVQRVRETCGIDNIALKDAYAALDALTGGAK